MTRKFQYKGFDVEYDPTSRLVVVMKSDFNVHLLRSSTFVEARQVAKNWIDDIGFKLLK